MEMRKMAGIRKIRVKKTVSNELKESPGQIRRILYPGL